MSATPPPARFAKGRLTVHDVIGTGGMASVYVGRWRSGASVRTVAVKRPHPHLASVPSFVAMLLDEARLTLRLRHPNIVQTLEVVVEPSDVLLVMDYVHGVSLSTLLETDGVRGAGIPLRVASAIVLDVASALQAAHDALDDDGIPLGIVHRDVSPHNVLVGGDGSARLLDFGIAKAVNRIQTTNEGQLKGKLQYTSPEALEGEAIDHRADVYALAVVLWEALTGQPLFASGNQGAAIRQILLQSFRPPSALVPSLPKEVDAVVEHGLARSPSARHASARELADALARAVPPAERSEVAAWLESVAGPTLQTHAELVARVEAERTFEPLEDEPDEVTLTNAGLASAAPAPNTRQRLRRAAALGGAILAVVLGLTFFASRRSPVDAAPVDTPRASATPSPTPSEAHADDEPAAPSPSDVALPRETSSRPSPIATPTTAARPKQSPHAPKAKAKVSCSPPTVIDARGISRFKPGCLVE